MDEEEFEKLIGEVTDAAADQIMPQLKLVNGQLRGVIDTKTREGNLELLSGFVTEIYSRGLKDGYQLGKAENV